MFILSRQVLSTRTTRERAKNVPLIFYWTIPGMFLSDVRGRLDLTPYRRPELTSKGRPLGRQRTP